MLQRRSFWMVVGFSVLTFGIYYYYWIYQSVKAVNVMADNRDGKLLEPGIVVLLTILTGGLYNIYWMYQTGNRMQNMGIANRIPIEESGTTYLMWNLFSSFIMGIGGLIAMYLYTKNLDLLIDAYNDPSRLRFA